MIPFKILLASRRPTAAVIARAISLRSRPQFCSPSPTQSTRRAPRPGRAAACVAGISGCSTLVMPPFVPSSQRISSRVGGVMLHLRPRGLVRRHRSSVMLSSLSAGRRPAALREKEPLASSSPLLGVTHLNEQISIRTSRILYPGLARGLAASWPSYSRPPTALA